MPTEEEIGRAIAVLCALALEQGGILTGVVEHIPDGGPVTVFHFDIHTSENCGHDIKTPFAGGTLQ